MSFRISCVLSLALATMLACACSSSLNTFHCETSSDCESEGKVGGVCEAENVCSFSDPMCEDEGQRYSDLAGSLSNECVGEGPGFDASDEVVDASVARPDGGTDGGAAFCGWGYDPVHFDPCDDPPATLDSLSLNLEGNIGYLYNTTSGTLANPQGGMVTTSSTVLGGNRILWTSSFSIGSAAWLIVAGDMPLIIASKSTIDIDGTVTVGSAFLGGTSFVGAGSEPQFCTTNASGRGEDCFAGGAGGGGGAFGGNGGTGGRGARDRNDCDNPDEFEDGALESSGGAGGGAAPLPTLLRGGCAGKEGGEGNAPSEFGLGGPGGGALHLTAATKLTATGVVHAGGAGGRKSTGDRSAGGGGGSGGMIGVEASTIEFTVEAVVSANGGGGGGGGGLAGALDGDDAETDGTRARGGEPEIRGTAGGDGGWLSDVNGGSPALTAERGGGGGGGGVGYILYYQDNTPELSGTISPAAVAGQ